MSNEKLTGHFEKGDKSGGRLAALVWIVWRLQFAAKIKNQQGKFCWFYINYLISCSKLVNKLLSKK